MRMVVVTGAGGFMGRNLVATLARLPEIAVRTFDIEDSPETLEDHLRQADFVFHLAGVNRPKDASEYEQGNAGLTQTVIDLLKKHGRQAPLLITSSIQAALDNPYGISKKHAEEAVAAYGRETGAPVFAYRLPNVFGKWSRPNYNSAVATFCHNIAHDLPIQINNEQAPLTLVYIDDVVEEFLRALAGSPTRQDGFCVVPVVHQTTVGRLAALIRSFRESRETKAVPELADPFTKKLYSTYLSYLPKDQFSYPLKMNVDPRGSFTEFLRTPDRGQFSINISKPGIVKGNHWHHTKVEKFLVVSGQGVIRFRQIGGTEIVEYRVSGDKLEVVDIPAGYTHSIANTGSTDMVTVMWVNEAFDKDRPDTIFEEV